MTTVGIIAEYNPFHNGHACQIQCIRKKYQDARIIAVMSGGFTQRGECAILSKWQRAESAVRNGVDLVVELPASYAVRSAQDFANGGVLLLNSMGVVDILAFGAKNADNDLLMKVATHADSTVIQEQLHLEIQQGLSYGAALRKTLHNVPELISHPDLLNDPNNILSLEYMRALKRSGSAMQPLPIQRTGADHDSKEITSNIASGTAIRTKLEKSADDISDIANVVSKSTYEFLKTADLPDMGYIFRTLLSKIHLTSYADLSSVYGINEGLENRLIDAAYRAKSLDDFIAIVSTKRYSHSRIRRIIFHILCGINKEYMNSIDSSLPQYIRVLAFNDTGRSILRDFKTSTPLPVITKFSSYLTTDALLCNDELSPLQKQLLLDVHATDLQGMCMNTPKLGRDFTTSPMFIK